jgi:hypothetical protein
MGEKRPIYGTLQGVPKNVCSEFLKLGGSSTSGSLRDPAQKTNRFWHLLVLDESRLAGRPSRQAARGRLKSQNFEPIPIQHPEVSPLQKRVAGPRSLFKQPVTGSAAGSVNEILVEIGIRDGSL